MISSKSNITKKYIKTVLNDKKSLKNKIIKLEKYDVEIMLPYEIIMEISTYNMFYSNKNIYFSNKYFYNLYSKIFLKNIMLIQKNIRNIDCHKYFYIQIHFLSIMISRNGNVFLIKTIISEFTDIQ